MKKFTITPPTTIDGNVGASVSHGESSAVTVTAKEPNTGATDTFVVQPGTPTTWKPPSGWKDVQFTAPEFQQETRFIVWSEAEAGAAEA